ncbi:hypothetical protein N7471_010701 [Penicillium samsonianum]|uniref:uncharacterized protein n=1 Tax=Penicillium samsonianum TaxID=1882272 RepID=UPI0025497875|nr:uncharacterized protein N7471_010701 [Penicillium samsonianum]KAJ6126208.1 hypothetical protein N7471_010701 [Penicillium samsonianum]
MASCLNTPVRRIGESREAGHRGKDIESQCDDLTQCLYELAKLQDSIRMSLAIRNKGPEADLHEWIKKHNESFSAEDSLSSTTADRASHSSSDEQCSGCQEWFPAYVLSFHKENCKDTQTKYGSSGTLSTEGIYRNLEEASKDELHIPTEALSSMPPVGNSMLMIPDSHAAATGSEPQGDVGNDHEMSAKDDSFQIPAEASSSEATAKRSFSNTSAFFRLAARAREERKTGKSPAIPGDNEPVESRPHPQKSPFQECPLEELSNYETFQAATAGLRKKLISQERRQRTQYQIFSVAFNLLSITQVLIGATITALGPSGGEHILAITILGAFITSIAGLLALLRGRGLSQRLRGNMTEIAKVLAHIEEQTILLRYGNRKDSNDKIDDLIEDTLKRYAIAEDIIKRNQPDIYAVGNVSQTPSNATETECTLSQKLKRSTTRGKRRAADEEMGTDDLIHL